jgi:hypothetical protein
MRVSAVPGDQVIEGAICAHWRDPAQAQVQSG